MYDIVEQYLATWNAEGPHLQRLLAEHWSTEVRYVDPMSDVTGIPALSEVIDGVHAQFPTWLFTQISAADAHHRQLRFSWGLGPVGEEPAVVGFDVVVLGADGRIQDVRGVLDKVPEPPSAGSDTTPAQDYALRRLQEVELGPDIGQYVEHNEATREPLGRRWLTHGAPAEGGEGPWPPAEPVVIGFSSLASTRDWYTSPADDDVLEPRTRPYQSHVAVVEGVSNGNWAPHLHRHTHRRPSRPYPIDAAGGADLRADELRADTVHRAQTACPSEDLPGPVQGSGGGSASSHGRES